MYANSADPDQTRSAVSDLDLHCLPTSHLCDARRIWLKVHIKRDHLSHCMTKPTK